MALNLAFIEDNDVLEIIITGNYTLDEAIERMPEVFAASQKAGLFLLLLNVCDLETRMDKSDEVIYAIGISNKYNEHLAGGGHKIKIAFLDAERNKPEYSSALQVAQDENVPVNSFYNRDEALTWLRTDQS